MANITFYSNVTSPQRAYSVIPQLKDHQVQFFMLDDESIITDATDTEYLIIDAMADVGEDMISAMPNLKLIQSEGVGYQGVDMKSAKAHGVTVCNNKGINDSAVAECTVFLILACLKKYTYGAKSVYNGTQIETKKAAFGVVRELSECTVGLIGFGDIARQTARLLSAFGARVLYSNRTRYKDLEEEYNVEYTDMDSLLQMSDFVSLHLAVCDDTRNIADAEFFSKMKNNAYLINTARGDLVDNAALHDAIKNNRIAGAGLDVIAPEPVQKGNILLDGAIEESLVLTPHIAGITALTVKKLYRNCYDNILKVQNGKTPNNIVG